MPSTSAPEAGLSASVSGTCIGIAPEDPAAIFEDFRRVGTAAKKMEGAGLGLALSRKFRGFLVTVLAGVLAVPLAAEAQQVGTKPRLGLLLTGSPSDKTQTRERHAFTKKPGVLGWVDGQTVTLNARWAKHRLPVMSQFNRLVEAGG